MQACSKKLIQFGFADAIIISCLFCIISRKQQEATVISNSFESCLSEIVDKLPPAVLTVEAGPEATSTRHQTATGRKLGPFCTAQEEVT